MASKALPPKYLKAGEEYLAALQTLGLEPEFLGWGLDKERDEWNLVLVTSIIEIGGPLALSRLLFKAYNMHATPKEISPFIVRTIGSETFYAPHLKQLTEVKEGKLYVHAVQNADGTKPDSKKAQPISIKDMETPIAGLIMSSEHVYIIAPRDMSREEKVEEWSRFKRNVESLAA